MEILIEKYESEKKKDRLALLEETLLLLGPYGVEVPIEVLGNTDNRVVSEAARNLLSRMGEHARSSVEEILEDDSRSGQQHCIALRILADIGGEEEKELVRKYLHNPEAQIREEALYAMVKIDGPGATSALEGSLRDQELKVRRRAASIIRQYKMHSTALIKGLIDTIQMEPDKNTDKIVLAEVKAEAIKAMGVIGNAQVGEGITVEDTILHIVDPGGTWSRKLLKRLKKTDIDAEAEEEIKLAVCETLAKIGTKKSIKVLEKLVEKGPSSVSRKASQALNQLLIKLKEQK